MSRTLTADRFKVWLAIAVLAAVALGSFWALKIVLKDADDAEGAGKVSTAPDYYVEQFDIIKRSAEGDNNYRIRGERLEHLPVNDHILITQPRVLSMQVNQVRVSLRADRAEIIRKSDQVTPKRTADEIYLYGNVDALRPQTAESSFSQLKTEYLVLFPDADMMTSDQAVMIFTDTTQMNAIGMIANNKEQTLELLNKVRIKINPVNAPKNQPTPQAMAFLPIASTIVKQ
jgi:lipopolysaccharide export system protein LptC